jgi:sulfite exporter TauE/SafE
MPVPENALFFLGAFAFPAAAGLLSGVSHCAAMCGPIHLFLARQGGRHLWIYHAGRVFTYAGLGAGAGLLSRSVALPGMTWIWVALYVLLGLKLVGVPLWPAAWGVRYGGWLMKGLRPLTARLAGGGRPWLLLPLGLAAGFLPCATTQAGLAWAVGSGDPVTGGTGMLLLGAGTLPLFLAVPTKWMPRRGGWFHIALGVGLLGLAAWKTYNLVFAPAPACH